jgi:hypothetical protein
MFGRGFMDPFGMLENMGFGRSMMAGGMFGGGEDPFEQMDRFMRGGYPRQPRLQQHQQQV